MTLRFLPVAAFAALVAMPAAAETPFRSAQGDFEVTLPDGWTSAPVDASEPSLRAVFDSPVIRQNGANCNVALEFPEAMKTMTQEQINALVAQGDLEAAATNEAKSYDPNAEVRALNTVDVNGALSEYSEVAFNVTEQNGQVTRYAVMKLIVPVPGIAYNVNCTVLESGWEAMKRDFSAILGSFRVVKP